MEISGWGQYPRHTATVIEPPSAGDVQTALRQSADLPLITRGRGKSYGDSSLANSVLSSRLLDNYISLDQNNLKLQCGAGITLGSILELIVPLGAFLPVLPGTRHVSAGGALAADIHGKNHHGKGSFSDHVDSFRLCLANGEIKQCSRTRNKKLFAATCGGMGLTGIVLDMTLKLLPIGNDQINNRTVVSKNLDESLALLAEHSSSEYVVSWIDCLAKGDALGRGVVFIGEHATGQESGKTGRPPGVSIPVPFHTPGLLLNRYSMSLFNNTYYGLHNKSQPDQQVHYERYFFPLDRIQSWNRLYGRRGFLQYQLVLPLPAAKEGIRQILERVADAGKGSFLAVLKQFGPGNDNYLSFPCEGITLTLDFKKEASVFGLLEELDKIVLAHQGRLYLAKDARMTAETFKACYPNWEEFLAVKQQVDPDNRFASLQSDRLGLTPARNTRS